MYNTKKTSQVTTNVDTYNGVYNNLQTDGLCLVLILHFHDIHLLSTSTFFVSTANVLRFRHILSHDVHYIMLWVFLTIHHQCSGTRGQSLEIKCHASCLRLKNKTKELQELLTRRNFYSVHC